jgi:cation:H+ antiporter
MVTDGLLVLVGFVLLIVGADFLVRGAVDLAQKLEISPLVIGLTVVAFGTSLPELVVSVRAVLGEAPGLAVGNVVGSNIANILLILGAGGLITPIACQRIVLLRDGSAMLVATAFFAGATIAGGYGPVYGILSLLGLTLMLGLTYWGDRRSGEDLHILEAEEVEPLKAGTMVSLAAVIGGLAAVIGGGELLVEGAINVASAIGVSDEVIGLTLVAFGTSVPELATTVVAALRRHVDVALGNVLGSNLFNILAVLGVTSLFGWIPAPATTAAFDVWVLVGVSVLLLVFMRTGWRLGRRESALFLVLYAVFIIAQFNGIGGEMVALAEGIS